jgi:chemotaxis methyl-accepting protein methylase
MQIQNISSINYYNKAQSPNFKSWTREVLHKNSDPFGFTKLIKHRNDTWLFRDCLDWKRFGNFLVEKYKYIPKVNVYNYACSNGSEAYTFIMEMFSHHDFSVAKKFMPVIAKDYDQTAIDYAQSGLLRIEVGEKGGVNLNTNGRFPMFFTESDLYEKDLYEPRHILTSNVLFSKADILEDYKTLPKENTVVLARNFWPYLKYNERIELAKNLYNHLGDDCTLVIGSFDNNGSWDNSPTRQILENAGFKQTQIENVFTK